MKDRDDIYPSRSSLEPALLERRDPVVYGQGEEPPVSPIRVAAYERDGFLVLNDLFSAPELDALRAERDRLRAMNTGLDADAVIVEPGSLEVRSIFSVHKVSSLFRRLAHDARLVAFAEYVLGERVYIHQSRLNYKPGFVGKEFYWHSDFETWHVEDGMPRMRALSVSISLSDNSEHNGPLMLIPGSHYHYVSCVGETPEEHFRRSLRKQEYGVPDRQNLRKMVGDCGIRAVTGPAGTAAFFDCNTMHGSNGNITPQPRSNVFIVYNAVSNRLRAPYGADKPRPAFLAERSDYGSLAASHGFLHRAA
jgi:ectoine hydroxylase